MFPPLSKLIHILSSYLSYTFDGVNHKSYFEALGKSFNNFKTNSKSNFNLFTETIMPGKLRTDMPTKPIDAIRGLFESQQLELNDMSDNITLLCENIKQLEEKIKELEEKNAELLKEPEPEPKSPWFFA
tara:strand:+ start:471 stop:857 length:387 start_codon:yes stop_codon:yes gene_type:complete